MLLAWARDRDGRKVHALRLDPADRRRRAPFTCLGCGDELVPHLGKVRRRHFAHRAGSACPLTAPETALHLDAKERLLALCEDAFAGRRRVTLLARCPSCRRAAPRDLAREGDRALTEGAVGALRADVLVLAGERPALAIEVVVTHAVDAEKEAALSAAGVPAVEIDAREEWEGEDAEGISVACLRSLGFRPCPACAAEARADADRALGGEHAEIAELEAYRARGFFGARPALASATPAAAKGDAPLSDADRADLAERFRCPECGGGELGFGARIARHACPDRTARPVAWRGYDGTVVALSWWRR
ncbi:competence protein CoiA family protein [Anaeromyxobacter sp. SG26]|uniref:competence protein CoiA family protein n=1 Tax=Anaeromyxobacter sp. SG26 TaxID=2925407 RepID=UPI001F5A4632|nr:competence protein CoiA family protein [Anaeromyxobacter sp. SG26]